MPCDEMRDRLSPYLEGELGDSERKALEAHLGECADCAALLAVLRESVASLRAMPEADPPASLARKIQQAVSEKAAEQSRPRTAWGWTWMPAFAAAASFLVMIGLIAYLDRSAETPVMIAAKVEQDAPRPAPVPPPVERMRAVETEKAPVLAKEAPEAKALRKPSPKPPLLASRAEEVGKAAEISLADKKEGAERARPAEPIPMAPGAARKDLVKIAPAAAGAPRPASLRPEVIITLSDPAVRERALSVVASLGGTSSDLREERKAKQEMGGMGIVAPREAERYSFPLREYDRLISELRALDPNLDVAPFAGAADEPEVRLIIRTKPREP